MEKFYTLTTSENNVWKNLAFETYLLNKISSKFEITKQSCSILFLWQNDNCVVIGKHQNPYKECDLNFIKSNDIKIARRITGGGAVFHDKENLNFSFIQTKDLYNKEQNFYIIKQALNNLGIDVEISGRNDILLNGKKFSGNAFYKNKYCVLHHGTILLNSNVQFVSKCLTPDKFKLKSKGVDSVKSRICNINDYYPDITVKQISQELIKEFNKTFLTEGKTDFIADRNEIDTIYKKYSSKSWIFNDYIDDGIEISKHFIWGQVTIILLLKDRKIENLNIFSDALDTEIIDSILLNLKNRNFNRQSISDCFIQYENNEIAEDIKNLLLENIEVSEKVS